jgi:hypothetical protein
VCYNTVVCDNADVFAVVRVLGEQSLLGLLNVGPHKRTVTLGLSLEEAEAGDYELLDVLNGEVWIEDGRRVWRRDELMALRLTLEPFSPYALLVRPAVPPE